MDTTNTRGLTEGERAELIHKVQRLEWLLKECIGMEEYELCGQIQNLIQRKYQALNTNTNQNEIE